MLRLVFVAMSLSVVSGSDVVLGVAGKSAFIECQLPVGSTLAWQNMDGYIIAVGGKVTNENNTKYVIEKYSPTRESLIVRDLALADETSYKCFDLNNASVYDVTKLNILAKPTSMNITSTHDSLLEGTTVNFTCESNGGKPLPETVWFIKYSNGTVRQLAGTIEDMVYTNGTGRRVNVLTTNITKDMYRAVLVCNISVPILFQETFIVNKSVLLAPRQPVITGYDGSFDENAMVSLRCSSNGSLPTASVYWLLDGNKLGDTEIIVKPEENGTFLVTSQFSRMMSRDYNGSILTCAVTNKVLEDQWMQPLMTSVTLFASYKPDVSIEQDLYEVEQHGNVTLSCNIGGNPTPRFEQLYWTNKDTVIDRQYYTLSNDSKVFSIQLNNVNITNAGNFSCHAVNRLGEAISPSMKLRVLYAPTCTTDVVQKYAVWMGKSVKLSCSMNAVPSDVLFTWRYETSQEIVAANQSRDNSSDDTFAHGMLDLSIMSQSHYNVIECRGRNSQGLSTKPCRYEIVPPGPPQAPRNCSFVVQDVHVTVKCNPGFDGGSAQQFVLQKLSRGRYETTFTQNEPSFTFDSYQNTTIRVCAFNEEYRFSEICDLPYVVVIEGSVLPQSDENKGDHSDRAGYIAGGVVASVGVIVVAILLVILFLRRSKQNLTLEKENSPEQEPNTSRRQMLKQLWKRTISSRHFGKNADTQHRPATPSVRRSEVITTTDIECGGVPYEDIVTLGRNFQTPKHTLSYTRLVSTPRNDSKCTDLQTTVNTSVDIEVGQLDPVPSILNESTGCVLSPIQSENTIKYYNEKTDTEEQHYHGSTVTFETKDAISNCYNTNDILDGLSILKDSVQVNKEDLHHKSKTMTKTLGIDYSCGDIVDALDKISDKNDSMEVEQEIKSKEHASETSAKNSTSSPGQSKLVEQDNDDSVTILKYLRHHFPSEIIGESTVSEEVIEDTEMSYQPGQDGMSSLTGGLITEYTAIDSTDSSATILGYAKVKRTPSDSLRNNISSCTTHTDEPPVLLRCPLREYVKGNRSKTVRCLEKSYSLPYRSNRSNTHHKSKTCSTSDLSNTVSIDMSVLSANCDIKSSSNDRHSDNSNNKTTPTVSTTVDQRCPSSVKANERKSENILTPASMSSLTDNSSVTFDIENYTLTISDPGYDNSTCNRSDDLSVTDVSLLDINKFTLTVGSEPSTVYGSEYTLHEDDKSRETLELMCSTRSFEDSLGLERNVNQRRELTRRGSFLEAIHNNSAFESDLKSVTPTSNLQLSVSIDTETEGSYYNSGFEMDMDSESTIEDDGDKHSDKELDSNGDCDKLQVDLERSMESAGSELFI